MPSTLLQMSMLKLSIYTICYISLYDITVNIVNDIFSLLAGILALFEIYLIYYLMRLHVSPVQNC